MAGKLNLSDATIRAAKASEKPIKQSDGRGLHLLVSPNGSRLWRMQYRFAGKQRMLAMGAYDSTGRDGLSLEQARNKVSEARALLKDNQDPAAKKKLEKIASRISNETPLMLSQTNISSRLRQKAVHQTRWTRSAG